MPRSDASNASARANRAIGLSAPVPPDEYRRRLYNERLIRFAIPILLASMAIAVGFSMIQHYVSSHTEAMFSAQKDLKQAASIKAAMMRLNKQNLTVNATEPTETSEAEEPIEFTEFVIVNRNGVIEDTSISSQETSINGFLRNTINLPIQASDIPGTAILANGGEVLLHAKPIAGGKFLFALRPIEQVTSNWWSRMIGLTLLIGSTLIAIIAVGVAYYLQAIRASNADQICATLSERMQLALSRGRCGIWDWQLRSGKIQWSVSMFDLLGMPPREEPLGFADIRGLMHQDDLPILQGIEDDVREARGPIDQELRLRHAEGRWVTLHVRADIVRESARGTPHLVGFALDVTEQRRLEDERRHADIRLRDAIESIPEAFVLWDRDNRLIVCNENYRRFHHLDEEHAEAGMLYETVHAQSLQPGPKQLLPIEGEGGAEHDHSYEAELADGRWLQVSERRTKDGGYVSIGTDITARKEQAARLIDNEHRLLTLLSDQQRDRRTLELQAMKLSEMARRYREQFHLAQTATRAKSAFLANMSHELRTPLNAIVGFAQMMEQKLFGELGSPRYADYVLDIRRSGEQMLDMVTDLLQMSRIEAGRTQLLPSASDLALPLGRALQAIRPAAAAKSIAISVDSDGEYQALIDVDATTQILNHVIGNAVKFSRSGGDVRVRLRRGVSGFNIFVSDGGAGIPPDVVPNLGRPFEQSTQMLHNGMKGSGLGLAIAVSLASLQHGALRIKSKVGFGTVVMIHLPMADAAPRRSASSANWTNKQLETAADSLPNLGHAA